MCEKLLSISFFYLFIDLVRPSSSQVNMIAFCLIFFGFLSRPVLVLSFLLKRLSEGPIRIRIFFGQMTNWATPKPENPCLRIIWRNKFPFCVIITFHDSSLFRSYSSLFYTFWWRLQKIAKILQTLRCKQVAFPSHYLSNLGMCPKSINFALDFITETLKLWLYIFH